MAAGGGPGAKRFEPTMTAPERVSHLSRWAGALASAPGRRGSGRRRRPSKLRAGVRRQRVAWKVLGKSGLRLATAQATGDLAGSMPSAKAGLGSIGPSASFGRKGNHDQQHRGERPSSSSVAATGLVRDVLVDWEALEDAFENNAPEVHSYLHLTTGEVLRVVDGVADPQDARAHRVGRKLPAHRSGELARAVPVDGTFHPDGGQHRAARKAHAGHRRQGRAPAIQADRADVLVARSASAGSPSGASDCARSCRGLAERACHRVARSLRPT